jgi:hypothetical protein
MTRSSRRARGLIVKQVQAELDDRYPPLSPELEQKLERYSPRSIDHDTWSQIRPSIVSIMRQAKVKGPGVTFDKKMRLLSYYFTWAVHHGYPCDRESLLNDQAIEDYIRRGCRNISPGSRSSYRSDLRSLKRAAGSELDRSHQFNRISARNVRAPYTDVEVSELLNTINYQPRFENRSRLQVAIALGLGAGIDSADLREVRAGDITDHGHNGIEIEVRGTTPRHVWLLHDYEEMLRSGLRHMGPRTRVVTGTSKIHKNSVNILYQQIVHTGRRPPKFEQARMRNTWLIRLLQAPIPLALVMQAAGLKSARTLTDLVTYVNEWHHQREIPNLIKEMENHVHTQ